MLKTRIYIYIIFASIFLLAFLFSFNKEKEFSLGLDLAGGSMLVYDIDITKVPKEEIDGRVSVLRDVIEKRVNSFGVSEASVYIKETSIFLGGDKKYRLVVELPGITDLEEAVKKIGETPFLEFKLSTNNGLKYNDIGLNGGHIKGASFSFAQSPTGNITGEPIVTLSFNSEGKGLFATLTRKNIGNQIGIFLDNELISSPVIRDAIVGGVTQIYGNFTVESATALSDNLNVGALPLSIELKETSLVSPEIGSSVIQLSIKSSIIAFVITSILMIMIYNIFGIIAVIALISYLIVMTALWKLIPVVLTSAGLVGFIMSIGFAVDANILIFERLREELRNGLSLVEAVPISFERAWRAIRDANTSSLIIAVLLFWFGTSVVKGFAFTFALGVIVSMISSFWLSRTMLILLANYFKNLKL